MALIKLNTRSIPDDAVTPDKVSQNLGRRNLIINGAMQVAQRGTSVAMAHDGLTSQYLVDRWRLSLGGTHEQLDGTYAQVADHPTSVNGKSLKWTTGTAESSYDADEYGYFVQVIEARNAQHLQYGNSNAQTITVSFYVKSSITGTYAIGLYKPDSTGRIFNKTYAISSANTWEKKTISFVGDTSGGGIDNDNGQGLWISWHLAGGANYIGGPSTSGWVNYSNDSWAAGQATNAVLTTANATWQMTECQVEVGDSASDFEHRTFEEELHACKRYYQKSFNYENAPANGPLNSVSFDGAILGYSGTNNSGALTDNWLFSPEMRATPTVTRYGNSSGYWGRMSMPNSSVTFDNGAGYISNTKATGLNFGQNVASNTHICGFGHAVAEAEL